MEQASIYNELNILGQETRGYASPQDAILERVSNPHPGTHYLARFVVPEFTSLWLVESKSLKLYLSSFRNHGAFHEDCTVSIGLRLKELLSPVWLRIGGYWYPRGGIPIDVFYATGPQPEGMWIPDQGVPSYRGRG